MKKRNRAYRLQKKSLYPEKKSSHPIYALKKKKITPVAMERTVRPKGVCVGLGGGMKIYKGK